MSFSSFYSRLPVLYLGGALMYYLSTWYAYGGFVDKGHPAIYNLTEFCASGGLKFTVYFLVSILLFPLYIKFIVLPGPFRFALLAVLFVFLTGYLEQAGLSFFGWANIFGGRLIIFSYLLAGAFFVMQWQCLLVSKAAEVSHMPAIDEPQKNVTSSLRPLRVTRAGSRYQILPSEILYVEAFGNYTKIFTLKETFLYGSGIGKLCSERHDLKLLRIHRKYAIMESCLLRVRRKGRATEVILEGGVVLKVGKAYLENLSDLGIVPV
ncbi:LytTR family DNA-binding domain-containing protein [Neolewinella agarilytica]|uniref:LytTR family DNA-binding domain-containing protein n=1 Tax=Neolewinella agarilytica TaxID=478744 RepID=UPI0023548A12|nr:LytTR family DNA-binding domain-containing protein [Neolewinella agarilytica]